MFDWLSFVYWITGIITTILVARFYFNKSKIQSKDSTPKSFRGAVQKRCTVCGVSTRLELHHIIPLANGGSDTQDNLTLVCSDCHKKIT